MDFLGLLKRLHSCKVEFAVVGGYASMLLGSDMLTQDLDVCIRLGEKNLNRVFDSIEDLNPRYRMSPQKPGLTREMAASESVQNLCLITDLGMFDCLGHVKGLGDFEVVLRYSRKIQLSFGFIYTLDFEGLIKAKSALDREKDKLTIVKLQAIQEKLGK